MTEPIRNARRQSQHQAQHQAQSLEIDANHAGQRIDNFLVTHLKGVPKSRIYRLLRRGEVRVNKGRVKPDYRLNVGDKVRIPPVRREAPNSQVAPTETPAWLGDRVLYEDAALLVLNKPAGMAVHGGSGQSYGVIEALRALRTHAPFLELVHRLDRETSGCLLIAKRASMLRGLHELLRNGTLEKRYLALVQGRWGKGKRRVELPLVKNVLRSGERMVSVHPEGKSALSLFRPKQLYPGATLMEITLMTGRTHQIRVHAAASGHPVAGDEKYGVADFNRAMRKQGLRRLFLHASALNFRRPDNGEHVRFEAGLDEDLGRVLANLHEQRS